MSDLRRAFTKSNLERAWRWINSNPSYEYKNYFRDSYSAYNISLDKNLTELTRNLKQNVYRVTKPTLLLLPKNNFSTRPYTLLAVEDQIVYQAMVGYIAEQFYARLKKNYYKLTFGNLYAGKRSPFFYRKWDKGYATFNKTVKDAYVEGYDYFASFDLTACFDTIDHSALGTLLLQKGLDLEFVDYLKHLLKLWSSNVDIYKGHGIPQGPLSSGLLAEVFLHYFDEKYIKLSKNIDVRYFRYVDDIVLLAKNDRPLTIMLSKLDFYSKQIGVFPQSAKIEVKKISNIDNEIKDLSHLQIELMSHKESDYQKVENEFKKTYKVAKVINKTKFKMYLGSMKHTSLLSMKLIDILSNNPQYFMNISNYFANYPRRVSGKVVDRIIDELNKPEAYQVVSAALLEAVYYNVSEESNRKIIKFCRSKIRAMSKLNPQLRYVLLKILLNNNELKEEQLVRHFFTEKNWWVKKTLLKYVEPGMFSANNYQRFISQFFEEENIEISFAAISEVLDRDLSIDRPYTNISYRSQIVLKDMGLIYRSRTRPSSIDRLINNICKSNVRQPNWKQFFGIDHVAAETKMIRIFSYSSADMSACVNLLDTFNDILLDKLHKYDTRLGGYTLGKIGGVLNNTGTRLELHYPNLYRFCKYIHELRLECDLSHPIVKNTRKYTKPVAYREIYKIRSKMKPAIEELVSIW